MTAAEIGEASGIPEQVILEKFGLRGKHIAAADEHVSDMSVAPPAAARRDGPRPGGGRRRPLLRLDSGRTTRSGRRRHGSRTGSAAQRVRGRVRNVSCGTPVALRLARNLLLAEPELRNVLLVAACRESYLLDYSNERSRFMFNFGDGAVAGLLTRDAGTSCSAAHAITDGSFSLQVKVPAGGSVEPASAETVAGRRHFLDVADPAEMKGGLDEVSLPNFVAAARGALERSGARLEDIAYLCGIHMKRSMHDAIVGALGSPRAAYLDDTGHMSGVDSAARARPRRAWGRADRRRPRAAARSRNRLHVGRVGGPMVIEDLVGQELVSEWRAIEQERIDEFAHATDDAQWIHTDPEQAAAGPFGTTIAHGFLTLSLVVPMFAGGAAAARGLRDDAQLRPQPRPLHVARAVGRRIRGRFRIEDVEEVAPASRLASR